MNRPLALIEGDLALPSARPLAGLPPPFGALRRASLGSGQRQSQPAISGAPRYVAPAAPRRKIPAKVEFQFFYKLPQRADYSNRFDEQLAEARRYLAADNNPRPSSSRSDRVLGAMIFVGCSIALTWLLMTCSAHDTADTLATAARAPAAAIHARSDAVLRSAQVQPEPAKAELGAMRAPRTIAQNTPSVTESLSQAAHHAEAARLPQRGEPQLSVHAPRRIAESKRLAKIDRPTAIPTMTGAHVEQRIALSRSIDPPARPSVSKQPEGTASPSSANDSAERAALLDWASQQRRANVAMRANMPSPGETDWNAHMTQRRITDNPAAFQTGRAQP